MHGRDRSESTLAGRAERRVGARSLGPFLFLGSDCRSVSSQGPSSIRHRPYWSYGLLAGVLGEAASGGGTGTSCWLGQRPGTARAGITGRWTGDGFAAGSPALAVSGRITPNRRPQDRRHRR